MNWPSVIQLPKGRPRTVATVAQPACDRLEALLEKAARGPVSAGDLEAWAGEVPFR